MTLTLTSSQKAWSVISFNFGGAAWPPGWAAQLTRMSTSPNFATTEATMDLTEASEDVSHGTGNELDPSSAAAASRSSNGRARSVHSAPGSLQTR
jgi:hypothetical protein